MTRETKIGLIVAGSFLCLVCVVVASKLHRGDDPGKGASEEQTAPGAVAAVSPKPTTPAPVVTKNQEPPKAAQEHPDREKKKDGGVKPTLLITPPEVKPVVAPSVEGVAFPPIETPKVAVVVPPPLVVPPLQPVEDKKVLEFPKPKPLDPPVLTVPPPTMAKTDVKVGDGPPAFPPFTAKDGPPALPSVTPKEVMPVNNPLVEKDLPGATPKDGPPAFPTLPKEAAVPIVPPLGQPTPLTGTQIKPAPSITNTEPIKPGSAIMPRNPIPTIPPSGEQFIKMKNPNAKPMPIIRDTELYNCQPGDTTFVALSLKFYKTDKYAQALLHYNRDNYKATVNGTVFLNDAPVLVPGQQINVAPVSILERDYLAAAPRPANTSPIPTIPSTGPPLSKPLPLNPIQGTNRLPPSGAARTYTVQNPGGESILDIAERVLGDRGQWHKIWRVNPSYPPQVRIPAGAKLEIPAN